mmetsp:Transcript_12599/g.58266  ORF Transcript_12599/g.58266 Transcript_12599/m.58266 type:complete len:293 (-) Transcript_12599:157-1035(-)
MRVPAEAGPHHELHHQSVAAHRAHARRVPKTGRPLLDGEPVRGLWRVPRLRHRHPAAAAPPRRQGRHAVGAHLEQTRVTRRHDTPTEGASRGRRRHRRSVEGERRAGPQSRRGRRRGGARDARGRAAVDRGDASRRATRVCRAARKKRSIQKRKQQKIVQPRRHEEVRTPRGVPGPSRQHRRRQAVQRTRAGVSAGRIGRRRVGGVGMQCREVHGYELDRCRRANEAGSSARQGEDAVPGAARGGQAGYEHRATVEGERRARGDDAAGVSKAEAIRARRGGERRGRVRRGRR